jgi:hypothetical protein
VTPARLTRTAVAVFVVVILALLAVLFFQSDAEARRACEAKGHSAEWCGWR